MKFFIKEDEFSKIPYTDRIKILKEMTEDFSARFENNRCQMKEDITAFDPFTLIANLSIKHLMVNREYNYDKIMEKNISYKHIEYIQALLLKYDLKEFKYESYNEEKFRAVEEKLLEIFFTFSNKRFPNEKIIEEELVIEKIRSYTQSVRNRGYPDQNRKILEGIIKPIDHDICKKLNIEMLSIIDFIYKMIDLVEERTTQFFKIIKKILDKSKSIDSIIKDYIKVFKLPIEEIENLREYINKNNLSKKELISILVSYSAHFTMNIFTFKITDLQEVYTEEKNLNSLCELLNSLSYKFGDLKNNNDEHFFLNNPIWEKPFIKIDSEHFFLPIPNLLNSHCFEIVEMLLGGDSKLMKKYEKQRGLYLENITVDIFKINFPSAKVYKNVFWKDQENNGETDILLVLDRFLLVVEAKSGRLSPSAKRGGAKRLKDNLKKIIVHPTEQALKFKNYLQSQNGVVRLMTKEKQDCDIDLNQIKEIFCFSVTIENLNILRKNMKPILHDYTDMQLDRLFPFFSIFDLEVFFNILESESTKLHYLLRSTYFDDEIFYDGVELDLFTFYLDGIFKIQGLEANFDKNERHILALNGLHHKLDNYFINSDKENKPKFKMTPYWHDLISQIELRKRPGWCYYIMLLLDVNYEEQNRFLKGLDELVELLNSGEKDKEAVTLAICDFCIIGFIYRYSPNKAVRNQKIHNIIQNVYNIDQNVKKVLLIGFDGRNYPYNILHYEERGEPL